MHKLVMRENIKHCRDQLRTQIDSKKRAILQRILVEEEDKLGATDELIADVEHEIARARRLIAERRALIATMERCDCSAVEQAKALLDGLIQTHELHERYRRKLRIVLQQRLQIEAITDYAVYMLDEDGFVASWNSGAERIKG